ISVVGFVYTQCTTVCPVISAILQKLQKQLGERAGREVQLVSLSIDPQRDTPERLKEYAGRFSGGEGWRWVTGSQEAIT
ncbi:SCO family protein, partial [Klebsiella pneumoniae]|nr:SCO family protein [Klebsiella pneumoniae]